MSQARVGAELRDVAGVADVRANTLTGTVLVRYDPERTGVAQIRARLERPAPPARRRAGTQRAGIDGRQLALVGF
ncbi:MAG: cation transporter [Chloroflexi bacterium]|nr:cation transporter [Chloroflexota bacterium]